MSLTDNSNLVMPVGPMYGNGSCGSGMFGDGLFWIIVLFLFGIMGNGFGGAWGGNAAGPMMMNTNNDMQRGFDQQAVMNGIYGIAQGQTAGFAAAESSAANRQMATMQQGWAMQTDIGNRLDGIQLNQQTGLCENRAAIADIKYTIAQEGAATRADAAAKSQAILDELHQMQMENMKQNYENRLAALQAQLNDQQIQINNANRDVALANEVDALYDRMKNCPVPSTPVYGMTPIFTTSGCNRCNNGNQFLQTA